MMKKTSEIYKKLYHYTTWEGLKGILQTQSLWATNYKFLNDFSELVLFRDRLIALIYPVVLEGYKKLIAHRPTIKGKILEQGGIEYNAHHDAEVMVDSQYRALGNEVYILSFCGEPENQRIAENGLLSQWRGYGTGGGAALIFDTEQLEELLAKEVASYEYSGIILADLIYSDDDQKLKEELADELKILADVARQFFNHENVGNGKEIDSSEGYFPFVSCISRYKHVGFCEENEVRVVALPTVIDSEIVKLAEVDGTTLKPEKLRKHRMNMGHRVPYIELFDSPDIKLPIEKIIIGPHKEKEARKEKICELFPITNIEVVCSNIPFVGC